MLRTALFIAACALAALSPLWSPSTKQADQTHGVSHSYPTEFRGQRLTSLPLTEREQRFAEDFPGEVRRFTDGEREIIIRLVTEATRKLHPAADCFRGIGYEVRPLSLRVDEEGARWSCFGARKGAESLRVCERISDGAGGSWADVSSWYWAAAINSGTRAPWWAITVAERETMSAE